MPPFARGLGGRPIHVLMPPPPPPPTSEFISFRGNLLSFSGTVDRNGGVQVDTEPTAEPVVGDYDTPSFSEKLLQSLPVVQAVLNQVMAVRQATEAAGQAAEEKFQRSVKARPDGYAPAPTMGVDGSPLTAEQVALQNSFHARSEALFAEYQQAMEAAGVKMPPLQREPIATPAPDPSQREVTHPLPADGKDNVQELRPRGRKTTAKRLDKSDKSPKVALPDPDIPCPPGG